MEKPTAWEESADAERGHLSWTSRTPWRQVAYLKQQKRIIQNYVKGCVVG